jgi:hypothetical protein
MPAGEPVRAEPTLAGQDLRQIPNAYEPAQAEHTSAAQDAKLISYGYEPIAVNGKVPVAKGWNARPVRSRRLPPSVRIILVR